VSAYAKLKAFYRALLPGPARQWLHAHAPKWLLSLRYRAVSRLERGAATDELYDAYYYDHDVDPLMLSSADAIAESLKSEFDPDFVIDVGCGTGALLASFQRLGVSGLGLDYAAAALERCERRGLDARRFDIEGDALPSERADLAISTEVAEHLPESSADRFVELLTTLAPAVAVTAALPGSRGKDHVNEQPNEYWIEKFRAAEFAYDRALTMRLRDEWRDHGVADTFFRSLMVFRAQTASTR
jgi:SAM-dependent methyltransferase